MKPVQLSMTFSIAVRGPFRDSIGNEHYVVYLDHRLLADAAHKGLQSVFDEFDIPLDVLCVLGVGTEVDGTGGAIRIKAKELLTK